MGKLLRFFAIGLLSFLFVFGHGMKKFAEITIWLSEKGIQKIK